MPKPISYLGPLLRKLEYWVPLEPEDKAALVALPHRLHNFQAHQYIVRQGDRATHSCLMVSGYSIRLKIVANGARQIVGVHMKGDMVDLQNSLLGTADHSVQLLTEGQVAMIPREAVRKIAIERPKLGFAMWHDTLVDGSIFREWIANIGRRDAITRVAHLLCEFGVRMKIAGLGERTDYELPMTQEQIGDAVGLTAIHVNRTLRALEQQGFITRTKRSVLVADWKKLAHAADFDTTYLHLHEDEPLLG